MTVRRSGEHTGDLFAVYLGDDLLAEHRRASKGIKTVTLPAHAAAIRQLCRRDPSRARGRPGKQPTYEQVPAGEPELMSTRHLASPIVEVGTLEAYERLAEGAIL